ERLAGPDGALIRGAHWRNFMVKYAEANRMHKKMTALSALCRAAGDPPEARRAIGRAQCNDAYWHGVFGGLYLPHLRDHLWYELALAEGILRAGEAPAWEVLDIDCDGHEELWIHDATFSAILSPVRGGVIEEYSVFAHRINYANTLTRRREAYHEVSAEGGPRVSHHDAAGAPSMYDLEDLMRRNELPPIDAEPRVLIRERILGPEVEEAIYARGDYDAPWSVSGARLEMDVVREQNGVGVSFRSVVAGVNVFDKTYHFITGGRLVAEYRWNPAGIGGDGIFAPEVSYNGPMEITCEPATPVWSYNIVTVAKSEKDFDTTIQGRSVTPLWPASTGTARIELCTSGRS
ncbi:MAG: alpha-amylase/4-alpha-glucanotransferase domain-containing protein, partial [Gemmatimonadota bacterium]